MDNNITLEKAKEYEYIGELTTNVIFRQGRVYRLHELTDKKIERLLKEDEVYWSQHFQRKNSSRTVSSTTSSPKKDSK